MALRSVTPIPLKLSYERTITQFAFSGIPFRVLSRPHTFHSQSPASSSCLRLARSIHLSSHKAADAPRSEDEKPPVPTSSSDPKSEYSSPSKRAYNAQDETPEDNDIGENNSAAPQPLSPPTANSGRGLRFGPITRSPTFDAALTTAIGLVIGQLRKKKMVLLKPSSSATPPKFSFLE